MILQYPHPLLLQKALPMRQADTDLQERMLRAAPEDALGLAAPQIGVQRQLVFVREPNKDPLWIYNPRIQTEGELLAGVEGCLSLADQLFLVERFQRIVWKGRDPQWQQISGCAEDLLARILQHETDHLRGQLVCHIGTEIREQETA